MAKVRSEQYDTIDLLCYRHYGRTAGVVEAVYEANPGLADLGPVLPMGVLVTLPDTPPPPQSDTVQLWD